HRRAHRFERLPPVDVGARVPPPRGDRGGQHPVVGFGERGVLVLDVAGELGAGGFEDEQVLQPGDHVLAVAVDGHRGGALLVAAAQERVVVPGAADRDPVPAVLFDQDAGAVHRRLGGDEVPAQSQREVLYLADRLLLGEGVDGVLLGVGGQDRRVVAFVVGGVEVATQRRADGEVLDAVPGGAAVHRNQADFRLAVLVGADDDPHWWSTPSISG